jgi:hypothetical protein
MRTRAFVGAFALAAASVTVAAPCLAAHHLWQIWELYSNADGSVQYVQLFNPTTDTAENFVSGFTVKLTSVTPNPTFTFSGNLPAGSTSQQWILIATSNAVFSNGVTPDYTLPANFLTTGGGTLNYAGVDALPYGMMPTDGVHSLMRASSTSTAMNTVVNSATKFNGPTGAIVLPSVPALPQRWAVAVLVGGLLLAGSGLLRKRGASGPATPA